MADEFINPCENIFEKFNEEEKKGIARITYEIISRDVIIPWDIAYVLNMKSSEIEPVIQFMLLKGLLIEDEDGKLIVAKKIPDELYENLIKFYSEEEIENVRRSNVEHKIEVSKILDEIDFDWNNIDTSLPEAGKTYLIRIENRNSICSESRLEIAYVENIYLATYDGKEFSICPPYVVCDLRGMTDKSKVLDDNDNISITHFAEAPDEAIKAWKDRLKIVGNYNQLSLLVDDEHEKDVYSTLAFIAGTISEILERMRNTDLFEDLVKSYKLIKDLQTVMDIGGKYSPADEVNKEV